MEEVSVQVAKVQAPIPIPKLDLGFGRTLSQDEMHTTT